MQLMVSRSYPVIDAQMLAEYVARDALFRVADGSYFLYMASKGRVEGEERILFLDCRDALLWLSEAPDALGSYWHFAECEKPPVPRTVIGPNRLPPVNLNNPERDEIRQCVANFKAHQERFAREREDFAASQLKRMLGRS
jgi:hypothetical protein